MKIKKIILAFILLFTLSVLFLSNKSIDSSMSRMMRGVDPGPANGVIK